MFLDCGKKSEVMIYTEAFIIYNRFIRTVTVKSEMW